MVEVRLARPEELEAVGELTVRAYAAFTRGPGDPYVARLRDAASTGARPRSCGSPSTATGCWAA